jgi:hypothetical protein
LAQWVLCGDVIVAVFSLETGSAFFLIGGYPRVENKVGLGVNSAMQRNIHFITLFGESLSDHTE